MAETFTPQLIVFDVNKTLIRDNSWQRLNKAMGVEPDEDDMLMRWGKNGIITDQEGQEILRSIYKKRGQPTRKAIEEIVFDYTYFDGAQETIKGLQDRGFAVALLSGSMNILVEHMARELGVERFASNNQLLFDEGGQLEAIRTVMNDEDFKVVQLAQWCSELNIRTSQVAIVGDGASDRQLAAVAGFVVAFSNESAIASIADISLGETELPKLLDHFNK